MPVPAGSRPRLALRIFASMAVVTVVEGLCGLYGALLQHSPSNFGCFFVIFTVPIGAVAGCALPLLVEKRRMSEPSFYLLLGLVTVVIAALTLLYIATRQ